MHNGLTKIEHGLTISEYAHTVNYFPTHHEDFVNHTNQKTDAIGNGSCTFEKSGRAIFMSVKMFQLMCPYSPQLQYSSHKCKLIINTKHVYNAYIYFKQLLCT